MISRTLGSSRKFAALLKTAGKLGEFCQALYPLIVANSDDFGRMAGDAFTVKHAVFPTSPRKESDFHAALVAMHNAQLIRLYQGDDGQPVIQVCQFDTHQPGLSKRTKSRFSEPPVNFTEIPESPGKSKATELNRTELKGTEQNGTYTVENAERVSTGEIDEDLDTGAVTGREVGAFIKRFCELYSKHRFRARYFVRKSQHVPIVRQLLQVYPLPRLEKLAVVLLTTDDSWVSATDRGLGILSTKAAWLDGLLAEYEAKHGEIQVAS